MNNAKIIAVTQPTIESEYNSFPMEVDQFIAYEARVSNPSNQNNTETSSKLLRYCIRNEHWSIFEMVHLVLEINTTRDIARQILRHRSFSFQEFSQSYADTSQLGFTVREARLQDNKNRQNSIETDDSDLHKTWKIKQEQLIHETKLAYKWAIENGIAKEQARAVLPEGLTNSRMYVNGTLRSWIHYIEVRAGNGTQKEHQEVALECARVIAEIFPLAETLVQK